MNKLLLTLPLILCLGACQNPVVSPSTVCSQVQVAQNDPTVADPLNKEAAKNTAVGQIWQYVQSGCNAGQPVAGVSASWEQEVLTMLENTLPVVLPALVGLI